MIKYYGQDFSLSREGESLNVKAQEWLSKIFQEELQKGGSPREVAAILHAVVSATESQTILEHNWNSERNNNHIDLHFQKR